MSWFTWIKEKLGIKNSAYFTSDESDSDVEDSSSDSDDYSEAGTSKNESVKGLENKTAETPSGTVIPDLTTDAARKSITLPRAEQVITIDSVQSIEHQLDPDEIISLVFLLYENCHVALQELTLYHHGSNKKLLYEWAIHEQHKEDWQKKLVEALCIVKNYKVLKRFGYHKMDLVSHYLPHQANATLYVNKIRKALYIMCERLDEAATTRFIDLVRKDFQNRHMDFKEYGPEYLELYLLYMETSGFFQQSNLRSLKNIIKLMDQDGLYNLLEEVTPRTIPPSLKAQDAVQSNSTMGDIKPSSSYEYNQSMQTDNQQYNINPKKPGVVMIINQEIFYTEFDEQYKHLLPPDTKEKLDSRLGTTKDKEQLITIFKKFGFKIVVKNDLDHNQMVDEIKEVVASITDESSFFLCILSHGDKGVVYGCNSCKVRISHIQQLVSQKNLLGKPKVLILQSCQGRQCQILNEPNSDEDEDLENNMSLTTDGPSSGQQGLTRTVDILLFWATVPGYAAIRDKKNGSWFIQTLCKKMEELQNTIHFADICTRTSREVSNKVWENEEEKKAMTPMVISTLRFDFFLPPMTK